ncbi:Octopamine receptor beta-2R [Holothuria leucospilota]|uniref:Octopamine receptor beta-2R n=1 Tax=Holothuria leucospilota TaxID=206669 RepID=A0A9Q1CFZ2_HOLLE|nr:Octopamine receptor beta-2R [Holothuria leucospilota]
MNTTGSSLTFNPYITAFYILIYLPVWIAIISGNLLVMLAFVYHKELRKVKNYFLVSLAATDFLTGLVALPLHLVARLVVSQVTCWSSSRFIFFLPDLIFGKASAYHLLCVAIDRCLSVLRPLQYPYIVTTNRVKVFIAIIWLYNIAFVCLPLHVPSLGPDEWVCAYDHQYENEVNLLLLITAYEIPAYVLFMILVYTYVLTISFHHIKKRRELTNSMHDKNQAIADAKARFRGVVTMATVVGAFGICLLPTSFKLFFEIYIPATRETLITVQTLCEYMLFLNSMLNPIIYGYLNQQFRAGFKKVLEKVKCRYVASS